MSQSAKVRVDTTELNDDTNASPHPFGCRGKSNKHHLLTQSLTHTKSRHKNEPQKSLPLLVIKPKHLQTEPAKLPVT